MSQERKASSKLARARRQNEFDEEDAETGPAIIDDSASEANSDEELQLSGSDEEEEEFDYSEYMNSDNEVAIQNT